MRYPSGNSLFWYCQGDKLATCPCYCWSSPALQFFSWLLCAYAWETFRAVCWLYTEHCYLQLHHPSCQQAHWTSALLPSGLTWTDPSRAMWEFSILLVLHVLGKLFHNMLVFTPTNTVNPYEWWESRKANAVLKMCELCCWSKASQVLLLAQLPHQCYWVWSCR